MANNNHRLSLKINVMIILVSCVLVTSISSLYKSAQIFTNASAQNSKESTINVGTPFYVEHYKIIREYKITGANGASKTEGFFIGNGTVNGNIKIDASGSATLTPRPRGISFIQGKGVLISSDNTSKADYIFQAIEHSESLGGSKGVGAAFFDSNATGNLSFLNNKVGVYKDQSSKNGNGTFTMWEWNNK